MIPVDLGQCVYVDEVLTVYPAVFKQDCTLYITVDTDAVNPAIYTGDIFKVTTAEALEYVTLARVTGMSAITEFGICVSNHAAFSNPVAVGEANNESETVLFPATQVGADGSFAVGLVSTDVGADHFAAGLLVKAYYKDSQGNIVFAKDTKTFGDGNWFDAE